MKLLRSFAVAAVLGVSFTATLAPAAVPPSAAPDFTLRTMDGRNLRLQEQRGRVVMINFWATWCGPCRQEMPQLAKLYDKYRASGFELLAVNVDLEQPKAMELATKWGLKFPVLFDPDKKVAALYQLPNMPSTVLIDRDGRMRYLHKGYREGYEVTYDQQIRDLLKE